MRGSAHLHSTVCIVSPPDGDDTLLVAPAARFVRNVWLWVHDMTHVSEQVVLLLNKENSVPSPDSEISPTP